MRDPLNTTDLAVFDNGIHTGTETVALRGFDPPVVQPPGISKAFNVYGQQRFGGLLSPPFPPRCIVQLELDSDPVFWGPAIIVPPLESPGAGPFDSDRDALERVTVVGGEQLLRESIVGPRLFETVTDVADIALELCQLYAHPALVVDAANFPATTAVLNIYYAPEKDLLSSLVELAESVPGGAAVWVDFAGEIHFEAGA